MSAFEGWRVGSASLACVLSSGVLQTQGDVSPSTRASTTVLCFVKLAATDGDHGPVLPELLSSFSSGASLSPYFRSLLARRFYYPFFILYIRARGNLCPRKNVFSPIIPHILSGGGRGASFFIILFCLN